MNDPPPLLSCKFSLVGFLPWTGIVEVFVVQAILCFRLHALYGRSRRVLFGLVTLFACTSIATIAALAHEIIVVNALGQTTNAPPLANLVTCTSFASVKNFYVIAIPVLTFDGTAFAMAAYKAYVHFTDKSSVNVDVKDGVNISGRVKWRWSGSRLLNILVRDSILYFILISTIYIANVLIWRFGPSTLSIVATGWSLALLSIAGNRMLLSIRKARNTVDLNHPPTITSVGEDYFEFANIGAGLPVSNRTMMQIVVSQEKEGGTDSTLSVLGSPRMPVVSEWLD